MCKRIARNFCKIASREAILLTADEARDAVRDAVATLVGLGRTLKQQLSPEQQLQLAAEVGSDVPLFLVGGTVLGVGRGEQVYPLPDLPAMACVVVTPEVGVSTPKAFAEPPRPSCSK